MRCKNPITINGRQFNCGKCIACRVNYTTMWSLRLLYELSTVDSASFLTLTYNNENLPKDFGLKPRDLTLFWKKLRQAMNRKYHEFAPHLTYYACGEYGSAEKVYYSPGAAKPHGRPHYHAIVFGLDNYNDEHRELVKQCWNLCEPWLFDKDRGKLSGMQEVTAQDINYVTGYVQKKLSGQEGKEVYGTSLPPFSRSSQGLGLDFAMQNRQRLLDNGWTVFNGHKLSLPRYFCEKFDVQKSELITQHREDPEALLVSVKDMEKMFIEDMHKIGLDYSKTEDVNLTMRARRFEQWYNQRKWDISKRLYEDFLQKQRLKGAKL